MLDRRVDPDGVHVYLHEGASRNALQAWTEAGLPLDRIDDETHGRRPITDRAGLHRIMGLHLNNRILADHM